jgi:hypothetical protein
MGLKPAAKIKSIPYSCKLKLPHRKAGGMEKDEEQIWPMT